VRPLRISPPTYAQVTLAALWLLIFIVVTGAAVRLTGSGLGCSEWPGCEPGSLTPHRATDYHPMVEFVNRLITGLVSAAVALAVLGAYKRVPYRRDLVWLALGLVAGVVAQIVLGAIVVKTELNPVLVQGHFVVSMALVADAVVLHHRAGRPEGPRRPVVTATVRRWTTVALALAAVVILTGTVVTGSGPHAGDEEAKRLPFTVAATARVHGLALIAFLLVVVAIVVRLRREDAPAAVFRRAQELLTVLVLQAAVGYTQYFTGVPALLVALHVLGASLVWVSVLRFTLELTAPVDVAEPLPDAVAPVPAGSTG